jgi:hypothetical protein
MTAYFKILLLRWGRSPTGIQVLVGTAIAPVAFNAAAYWIYVASRPVKIGHEAGMTITISTAFFSCLAAAFAFVHLMTRTIHTEKLGNRIRLLRSSGFGVEQAIACYLGSSALVIIALVPLSMISVLIYTAGTNVPPVQLSFVIATIAMVNLLGPVVIASRLVLQQGFALTLSYLVAACVVVQHTARSADWLFDPPAAYLLSLMMFWSLATALLFFVAIRDGRRKNRLWA